MRIFDQLRLRFRSLFQTGTANTDLDYELRFHLEQQIAANIAAGMPRDEARTAALREFGGVDQIREECTDMRNVNWLQDFAQDLRYGIRTLSKSPGFATIAIVTLALGIGANTAIFSMVNSALLRAIPVTDPQHLMLLQWHAHSEPRHMSWSSYGDCPVGRDASTTSCSLSTPFFDDVHAQTNVFSCMAAFASSDGLDMSGNGSASRVDNAEYVSGDYFQTLGTNPIAGRLIVTADDSPSASPVAVLSYDYWRSNFGGSPTAIGKTVLLNKVPFTIIGVAEPRFEALSPGNTIQLWLPLAHVHRLELPWDNRDADPNDWWLAIVGRLKPGVSQRQAEVAVNTMFRNEMFHMAKPVFTPQADPKMSLVPVQKGLTGDTTDLSTPLYVLMSAVGVVLLIACANVAGLLLSRATARHKEIALRFALGARRGRIVRQLLTESILLSIVGGVLALIFAKWADTSITTFVDSSVGGVNSNFTTSLDGRVFAFTAALSIFTGILFGLAPAFRGLTVDLTPALKEATASSGRVLRRNTRWLSTANALVIAQVALTTIILVAAGLLVRTLQNLKSVDPGFDTRNIITFRMNPELAGYQRPEMDALHKDLQTRLAAIPGVLSVSYSFRPLLGGGVWSKDFHLAGHPKDERSSADFMPVSVAFLEAMRIPLRLGRQFNTVDFEEAARVASVLAQEDEKVAAGVNGPASAIAQQNKDATASLPPMPAIVNEVFVKKYFPNVNPLGIHFGDHPATDNDPRSDPGWEILGVVANAKYNSLRRDIDPTIYVPATGIAVSFSLRTATDPPKFVPEIRSVVGQIDPNLPIYKIRTESQQIDSQLFQERLIARLSGFFGLLALVLACIGLYGLLSYEVSRRTREIGIRMALGAKARDVLGLVIGQGIALAVVGALLGIAIAFGITRYLSSLLYNVKPADPLTFVSVVVVLGAVAAFACYIPARRATRVDPLIALRYE